jgi:hypothetical protein
MVNAPAARPHTGLLAAEAAASDARTCRSASVRRYVRTRCCLTLTSGVVCAHEPARSFALPRVRRSRTRLRQAPRLALRHGAAHTQRQQQLQRAARLCRRSSQKRDAPRRPSSARQTTASIRCGRRSTSYVTSCRCRRRRISPDVIDGGNGAAVFARASRLRPNDHTGPRPRNWCRTLTRPGGYRTCRYSSCSRMTSHRRSASLRSASWSTECW